MAASTSRWDAQSQAVARQAPTGAVAGHGSVADKYLSLLKHMPLPAQLYDAAGCCKYVNPAWEGLRRQALADVRGCRFEEDADMVALGLLPYFKSALAGHTADIPPIEPSRKWNLDHVEHPFVRIDIFPVTGADGEVLEVVVMFEDCSEQQGAVRALNESRADLEYKMRESTAALLASESRFKKAQEMARLGYWELEVATGQMRWSDETYRILGVIERLASPVLDDFMARVHPEDRQRVQKELSSHLPFDSYFGLEHRFLTASDEVRYVRNEGELRCDHNGRPVSMVGIMHDITDLRRAEQVLKKSNAELERKVEERTRELQHYTESLERTNQELDQFAHIVSHDLKAPLRGIRHISSWVEEDLQARLTDESRDHLRMLKSRVGRLEELIDGILAYARSDRLHFDAEQVDTAALLMHILESVDPGRCMRVQYESGLPLIAAERVPLEQVLTNLISNALKYGDRRAPLLSLKVLTRPGFTKFEIADNGPGIEDAYKEKVFAMFQTLRPPNQGDSTGIGLAIVRKLAESRGGKVWYEDGVTGGAVAHLDWPDVPVQSVTAAVEIQP